MMVSPFCMCLASSITVASVASPAGTITQAARGAVKLATNSSADLEAVAPSAASCRTFSGFRSNTEHWCPFRISRRTMLPPIRPKPTIPSCIDSRFLFSLFPLGKFLASLDLFLRGGYNRFRRESEFLLQFLKRSGGAEGGHADVRARVAMPAHGGSLLH